jgi:hypothetical protein
MKYNNDINNPFQLNNNNNNNNIETESVNEILEIKSSSIDFNNTNKLQILLLGK